MAVAIPYIAIAATVASGVMSYVQSQRQAKMQDFQAELYTKQAEQEVQTREIQLNQAALENQSKQNKNLDEAVERRKRAYRAQQAMFSSTAARGVMSQPIGSLGAILEDSEEDLYRDMEASLLERNYMTASYLTQAAGLKTAQAGAMTTGRYQANAARLGASATRMGGAMQLSSSLASAYGAYQSWVKK